MTELVEQTAIELYSEEKLVRLDQSYMATEDFSFYLHKAPGCYFAIGNDNKDGTNAPACHHPQFVFQDEIIPIAAEILVLVASNYLNKT